MLIKALLKYTTFFKTIVSIKAYEIDKVALLATNNPCMKAPLFRVLQVSYTNVTYRKSIVVWLTALHMFPLKAGKRKESYHSC